MVNAFVLPDAPVGSYSQHLDERGGDALGAASGLEPDEVLHEIERADLRGRGGAWFPTATKWRTTRSFFSATTPATLVVNAAEGEPGSFKDRWLLRNDPYSVVEGAIIAADAVGADTVVFATKKHFTAARRRLAEAIDEIVASARPPLPRFDIVEGPDRYLFGEESALLEVVAGRPPFPRLSPPWRHGALDLDGRGEPASTALASDRDTDRLPPPALVQNVETLARVAHIVRDPSAYADVGATFLTTITGDVGQARVAEFPIGVSLRDVLGDDAAGAGCVMNGVTYPLIGETRFDLPLLPPGGDAPSIPIGAAAFQVFGPTIAPRAVAAGAARFLSIESCGQCEPCKAEGLAIAETLVARPDPAAPLAVADELAARAERVTIGARCGLAGQQRDVVEGLLAYFPDALVAPRDAASTPVTIAPLLDIVDGRAVIDETHTEVKPDWATDDEWSGQYPADVIDVAKGVRS